MRKLGGVFDRNWKTYIETANKYIRTHTQIVDVLYNLLEYSMLSTCIPIYVHPLSLKGAGRKVDSFIFFTCFGWSRAEKEMA